MENSERLGRQLRPGIEPGSSRLSDLNVEWNGLGMDTFILRLLKSLPFVGTEVCKGFLLDTKVIGFP